MDSYWKLFKLYILIVFLSNFCLAIEFYVSESDGTNTADCGLTIQNPCKNISGITERLEKGDYYNSTTIYFFDG